MSSMLAAKRILVTQANDFMGPTLCEVLAAHGADVIASDTLLTEPDAAERLIAGSGDLDVLVANLALPAPSTPAVEVTDDEWRAIFAAIVDPLPRLVRVLRGFDPDVVLGPRVADHGWGLGYMLNQRKVAGPNPLSFGRGGSRGTYGFVDLVHGIGYAYVMNHFDATKCNADPRSTALSDAVYRVLGVG